MSIATARQAPAGHEAPRARHRIGGEWIGSQASRDSLDPATGAVKSEEGGFKQSGIGRLNGPAAIEGFVAYRAVIHEVPV